MAKPDSGNVRSGFALPLSKKKEAKANRSIGWRTNKNERVQAF